jgi:DNA-3-methyladenine glycosylase I
MTDDELEILRNNPNIIRNRLKIYSTRKNAQVFLMIQKEFGTFDKYIWAFVNNKPIISHHKQMQDVPVTTSVSDAISKNLKRLGMSFVGSTIVYAYMQAIGMANDHITSCWRYNNLDS